MVCEDGPISEANQGLGKGFMDECGSARIRAGKREEMGRIEGASVGCMTGGDGGCTGGCSFNIKTG